MCGIVGLYCTNPEMEQRLGDHLSSMLIEMTDRGPDSAGVAIYRDPAPKGHIKVTLCAAEEGFDWSALGGDLGEHLGGSVKISRHGSHAVLLVPGGFDRVEAWLDEQHPELRYVALDIPTGVGADTGACDDVCFPAKVTLALGAPKAGLYRFPGASYAGAVEVLGIGLPDSAGDDRTCDNSNGGLGKTLEADRAIANDD